MAWRSHIGIGKRYALEGGKVLKRDESLVVVPDGLVVSLLDDLPQHIAVNIPVAGKDHATRLPLAGRRLSGPS